MFVCGGLGLPDTITGNRRVAVSDGNISSYLQWRSSLIIAVQRRQCTFTAFCRWPAASSAFEYRLAIKIKVFLALFL